MQQQNGNILFLAKRDGFFNIALCALVKGGGFPCRLHEVFGVGLRRNLSQINISLLKGMLQQWLRLILRQIDFLPTVMVAHQRKGIGQHGL